MYLRQDHTFKLINQFMLQCISFPKGINDPVMVVPICSGGIVLFIHIII